MFKIKIEILLILLCIHSFSLFIFLIHLKTVLEKEKGCNQKNPPQLQNLSTSFLEVDFFSL